MNSDAQASHRVARLEDVGLSYGKTRALEAVTLDIPSGCMVGLIGPDGVGKSSLSLLAGYADMDRRMENGEISLALKIPPGFGRTLVRGRDVAVGAWTRWRPPSSRCCC